MLAWRRLLRRCAYGVAMAVNYQRQAEKAEQSRQDAEQALNAALASEEDAGGQWARVRALQAQAQLEILHLISFDLSNLRD